MWNSCSYTGFAQWLRTSATNRQEIYWDFSFPSLRFQALEMFRAGRRKLVADVVA
jgi:hypothetical protein